MVEVKLKKPTRPRGLPQPPAKAGPAGNLHKAPSGSKVPLQLKISPELRREYRAFAAERDLELSELFHVIWEHYRSEGR